MEYFAVNQTCVSKQHKNSAKFLFLFVRKHSKTTKKRLETCHLKDHAQVVNRQPIGEKRMKASKKERKQQRKKKERKGITKKKQRTLL